MVELIYVALDSSGSHLFPTGLRTHLARALEVGASTSDILEVLHLVAVQGIASVGQAAAIVAEVAGLEGQQWAGAGRQPRADAAGPATGCPPRGARYCSGGGHATCIARAVAVALLRWPACIWRATAAETLSQDRIAAVAVRRC